jgi:thiamine pyrophosphate-dependent acetolactate synthase large subunit-like protein
MRVEQPAELPRAFEQAFAARRPVVMDVVTDHRAFSPKTWTGA